MKMKSCYKSTIYTKKLNSRVCIFHLFVTFVYLLFIFDPYAYSFQGEAYRLQEGDRVDISPIGSVSDYYMIPPDGRLYIPSLGYQAVLDVRNKTIFEVAKEIESLQSTPRPIVYRVKLEERYQGDVNVLGASKIIGKQRSDNLMAVLSNAGYDLEKWNENIKVCFSDTLECKVYQYKNLESYPFQSPYVPRGSTVFLSERKLYKKFVAIKSTYPWIGGIITGVVIALLVRK